MWHRFLSPLHHIIPAPARRVVYYILPFTQHLWQRCKERLVALQVHQEIPKEKQTHGERALCEFNTYSIFPRVIKHN